MAENRNHDRAAAQGVRHRQHAVAALAAALLALWFAWPMRAPAQSTSSPHLSVSVPDPVSGPVPTNAPAVATLRSQNRFLFIVDTSSGMKRLANDTVQTVDKIVRSSASGQLHPGDTIGVWTFNESLHTGILPLQTWESVDIDEIALRTTSFLREQKYEKKSVLSSALGGMFEIIKRSDIITIFIISDGSGKISGTPFDEQLNALYAQSVKDMQGERRPVVTVLQAQGGEIIKYTENALPWPVVIPELPIPIKNDTKSIAAKPAAVAPPIVPPTPQPALAMTNTPPPPVVAPTAVAPPPIAMTNAIAASPPVLTQEQQMRLIEAQRAAALQQAGNPTAKIPTPTIAPTATAPPNPAPRAMLPQPIVPPRALPAPTAPAIASAPIANIKPMGTLPDPNQPAPAPKVVATNRPAPVATAPKPVQAAQANAASGTAANASNQLLVQATAIAKSLIAEPRKLVYVAIGALAVLLVVVIIARIRRANRPSKVSLITSTFNTPQE